jgi:hypothetical protein
MYLFHDQDDKNQLARENWKLKHTVTDNFVPTAPILVTLMMDAVLSSETSVIKRTTRLHIQKDGIPRL